MMDAVAQADTIIRVFAGQSTKNGTSMPENIPLTKKVSCARFIDRRLMPYVKPSEYAVLKFIFTSTVEWNKWGDRLKIEHVMHGFSTIAGTGLGRMTIIRALKSLSDRSIIWRKRTREGYVLGINFDYEPEEILGLKIPKKERAEVQSGLKTPKVKYQNGTSRSTKMVPLHPPTSIRNIPEKDHTSRLLASPAAPLGGSPRSSFQKVQRSVEQGVKRSSEKTDKKKSRGNLQAIWSSAYRETFPNSTCAAWTKREIGQAKHLLGKLPLSEGVEIFDWCVRHWSLVLNTRFNWMETKPEYPALGFMLRFLDKFLEAWNDKENLSVELQLTAKDRFIRRIIRAGYTHEQAVAEYERRQEIAEAKKKSAQTGADLNDLLRKIEQQQLMNAPVNRVAAGTRPKANPVQPKLSDDF